MKDERSGSMLASADSASVAAFCSRAGSCWSAVRLKLAIEPACRQAVQGQEMAAGISFDKGQDSQGFA